MKMEMRILFFFVIRWDILLNNDHMKNKSWKSAIKGGRDACFQEKPKSDEIRKPSQIQN